jgi:hypothetical protein
MAIMMPSSGADRASRCGASTRLRQLDVLTPMSRHSAVATTSSEPSRLKARPTGGARTSTRPRRQPVSRS